MSFSEELKRKTEEVEVVLKRYLPEKAGLQKTVIAAMNYSALAGGKRLRPVLMKETYRLFGGEGEVIEPFLAAIEMVHTYSLIHDDLPAMDDDKLRRGKPTTHVTYGEAIAILAGDALLNYSVETVMRAFLLAPQELNRVAAAVSLLYRKSGIYGMIGGQTVDVETDSTGEVTKEQLDFIYQLKTGALIEASMMIGALLAGASEDELRTVEEIADKIGLAFQIRDDILDVTAEESELGKPVGSDAKNEKATYVTYEGVEKAEKEIERLTKEAVELLTELPGDHEFLEELFTSLATRNN